MTEPGDGWLREAMQLVLAALGEPGTRPLVLTVIAYDPAGEGRLVQLTASARGAPGRLYRSDIDPEGLRPDGNTSVRRPGGVGGTVGGGGGGGDSGGGSSSGGPRG